jgi:hypothetical protein
VLVSLTTDLLTFLSFIPAVIGAIIILVIGWILSGHLAAVTTLLNTIVLFIPNLVIALLIVMLGTPAARFVGGLVRAVASSGMANPQLWATWRNGGSSRWRRGRRKGRGEPVPFFCSAA